MKKKTLISILVVAIYLSIWYCWNRGHFRNTEVIERLESPLPPEVVEPGLSFPVHGSIFLDPDIITPDDPTTFEGIVYKRKNWRSIYDWRLLDVTTVMAFLFDAKYDDGQVIEVIVNPEFENKDSARVVAERYASAFGRLPAGIRKDIKTLTINKGTELFGGGGWDVLIHTGQAGIYERDGILEEALLHEAAHTSLDKKYETNKEWINCQKSDGRFVSTYAQENPEREDLAESYLLYMAARYRSDRITAALRDTILAAIPRRVKFFDSLRLDMYPLE